MSGLSIPVEIDGVIAAAAADAIRAAAGLQIDRVIAVSCKNTVGQ